MSQMKGIVWALFYKVCLALINFATSLITGRFLGAYGRGFYTNTTTYLGYYFPAIGSFSEYIPYGINKRKQDPQAVFSASLFFCLLLSGALFLLALCGTKWLWHGAFGLDIKTTIGMWVAGMVAPFAGIHVYVTRLMWGLNELTWLNRLNTVQAFAFFVLLLAVVLGIHPDASHSTFYVLGAWVLSFVLASFFSMYILLTKVKFRLKPRFNRLMTREIWTFGNRLMWGNLVAALNSRIDVTLVWTFLGSAHTGVYGVAVTSAEMLGILSNSILQVVLTRVSSLDEKDSALLTARIFRHTGVVVIFSAVVMYLLMPFLIGLYGKDFTSSLHDFQVLLPGMILYSTASVITTFFNNQLGKPQITTLLQISSILINTVVSVLLLPKIGEIGSAWAKTIAYGSFFFLTIFTFARLTRYPFWKLFYLQADEVEQYKNLFRRLLAFKK